MSTEAVVEGVVAMSLSSFDQGIEIGAGGSAFDGIAKEPGLTAHDEGAYGIFGVVIVYGQTSILEIANESVYARS